MKKFSAIHNSPRIKEETRRRAARAWGEIMQFSDNFPFFIWFDGIFFRLYLNKAYKLGNLFQWFFFVSIFTKLFEFCYIFFYGNDASWAHKLFAAAAAALRTDGENGIFRFSSFMHSIICEWFCTIRPKTLIWV